jgi:Peptidase M50B-like
MLVEAVYKVGRVLAAVIQAGTLLAGYLLPILLDTPSSPALKAVWPLALLFVGRSVAVVVHEAGHAYACLFLEVKVRAIYLGNDAPNRPRFTVGKFTVTLPPSFGGWVEHEGARSGVGNAFITAAGPLANLIVAATLAVALAAARSTNGYVMGLACVMVGVGVGNLMPFRSRSGMPTDGANLLAMLAGGQFAEAVRFGDANGWLMAKDAPRAMRAEYTELVRDYDGPLQPERTTRWLAYYRENETLAWAAVGFIGRSLRREGRISELLALDSDLAMPAGPYVHELTQATHMLAWEVLLVPGLPREAIGRAVSQAEWVLSSADFKPGDPARYREAVLHTLALGRLRQGRYDEAEELCQPILALKNLVPANRATVLATIALARKALGLPHEQLLAEAVALAPAADLVPEAIGNGNNAGCLTEYSGQASSAIKKLPWRSACCLPALRSRSCPPSGCGSGSGRTRRGRRRDRSVRTPTWPTETRR